MIKIERVTLLDFDEIDGIEKRSFAHPYPKTLLIHDFNNNDFSHYYKVSLDKKIIGYAGIWCTFEDGQIITIAIDPKHQGMGYGKKLLKFILAEAKQRGCEQMTLEVRVHNERAIQMYQQFGFHKLTVRKRYYENGDDAFLMKIDL
jgi:[ribosomal protein S18]-alanine N-acetyltransferase